MGIPDALARDSRRASGELLTVRALTVGAFQENCYIVTDERSNRSVVVDPGSEGARIVDAIEKLGTTLEAVWITHAHVDHVGAIASVKKRWDVPVYLHPLDLRLYSAAPRQAEVYGVPFEEAPPPDHEFSDGQTIRVGQVEMTVMHAPGHAPGHVVIHGHGIALVGDCLFAGSIGRTDLPFSNPPQLAASLEKITALPPETVVYPGHGVDTTIAEEKLSNPFLNGTARIVGR
ncbi:MAG TPA: MBL fold metallo-hydrolase [Gemmatimonadaceae bacterium]|nr:MBL fold metallo-hydrolase [Gemmatimonadaceae bacterium]